MTAVDKFSVDELALLLPPLKCRCARCMDHVGEVVTVTSELLPSTAINGGWAYQIRYLNGTPFYVRPEMLQKLPLVRDEADVGVHAHV